MGTGDRVGGDATRIVVNIGGDNAGADDRQQQEQAGAEGWAGAALRLVRRRESLI